MRPFRTAAALALLAALALAAPAGAADPYQQVSLRLAQWVVALFPPAEGYVVSASGDEVYVDLAEADLMRPGMELQLWRPGGEMVHPVTGQVLGAFEEPLGWLRLDEVRERYSRGTLAAGSGKVSPGDRARVSARRLRALLLVEGEAPGVEAGPLVQALAGRMEASGRVTLVDEPAWSADLEALGADASALLADPALLRRLGERTGADLLLRLRLGEEGGRAFAAADLRSLHTGAGFGERVEPWPAGAPAEAAPVRAAAAAPAPAPAPAAEAAPGEATAAAPAPPPPSPPAPRPAAQGEYVVRELAAPAVALAVGDLLGEGAAQVLVSDGSALALYRWGAEKLAWAWDEEGRGGRRVIALDAEDLDGDGRAEAVVVSADRGRLRSEIRSWRDGALSVVAAVEGVYLRVVDRPGAARVLVGQRAGIDEIFAGPVERYRLEGAEAVPVPGSELPRGVDLFGLALAPAGSPAAAFSLDARGHLRSVGADGRTVWRGGRTYGGYPVRVRARDLFGSRAATDDAAFDEEARVFQGRLLATAAAGGVRLAVPRNYSDAPVTMVRQRGFGLGEVVVLEGTGTNLEETARSRPFDGYVADLAAVDLDGDGRGEFLFAANRRTGIVGEQGRLVLWRGP